MTKIKYLFAGLVVAAVVAAPVAANATASQGAGHTPVTVCHNGSTLTVDDNALKAHLAHGDTEGPCQESTPTSTTPAQQPSPTAPTNGTNPTSSVTTPPGATTPTSAPVTPQPELPAEPSPPTESAGSTPTSGVPSPGSTPTTSPKYVLVVWRNEAGAPKFPQYLVASYETDSTNVKVLDQYAQLCGTFYQSDLYANDARTKALIAKGVLNGGDESWPDNGTQRYDTLTTQPCPTTEPTAPTTTTPEVTPSPSTPTVPVTPITPGPTDTPTSPETTANPPTSPGTTTVTPSTVSSDANGPVTEQKVTGTTTAPATEKRATNSLAMTGSETVMQWITIGALLLFVGVFAVLDARKMRKIAQKIK